MKEHISILRKDKKDDLYNRLQEKSIQTVQQLSGEIWTDFNEHDPGVTTLQALNYALTELDYRLQFDTADYLTPPDSSFIPVQNTLFLPEAVFPVNPVTAMDYRKLFLSSIDNLVNIWPVVRQEAGIYDFIADVAPGTTESRRGEIEKEILNTYHAHRNLCENIGAIHFLEHKNVSVHITLDIANEHANIEALIARLYIEIQEFLASGVRFRKLAELIENGAGLDEILEGPYQRRMVIDEESLLKEKKEYNFLHLYHQLQKIPGVHDILSFSLQIEEMELEEFIRLNSSNDLLVSYIVELPTETEEPAILLKKRGKTLIPDWGLVSRLHHIMHLQMYGAQNDATDKELLRQHPTGIHRNLFTHYPVKNDFPACYAKADSLHRYLEIFDNLITDGLQELKSLPTIMQLDESSLTDRKEEWLNMLDYIYGEYSDLEFFKDPEGVRENRLRRNRFLQNIPRWGYARGMACNLLDTIGQSTSGVEDYVKTIFFSERHELEIFILEHSLFNHPDDALQKAFILIAVFSASDDCMDDSEFINNCEYLFLSRIPAHIQTQVYWLRKEQLQSFRKDYTFWRYLLSTEEKVGLSELSDKITESLINGKY